MYTCVIHVSNMYDMHVHLVHVCACMFIVCMSAFVVCMSAYVCVYMCMYVCILCTHTCMCTCFYYTFVPLHNDLGHRSRCVYSSTQLLHWS